MMRCEPYVENLQIHNRAEEAELSRLQRETLPPRAEWG
jgi:hypothetical protein